MANVIDTLMGTNYNQHLARPTIHRAIQYSKSALDCRFQSTRVKVMEEDLQIELQIADATIQFTPNGEWNLGTDLKKQMSA